MSFFSSNADIKIFVIKENFQQYRARLLKFFCLFIMLVSRKLHLYRWKSGNVDNVIAATTTANQPLIKS